MCGRSSAGDLPHTRLPPADPYPCRKEEKQKQSMHEYYQSKIALDRAMQRLQTAAKYKR